MSIFERGLASEPNNHDALALNVINAVAKSPKLAKDNGLRHAGQSAALSIYHQLLTDAGVLQGDVDSTVDQVTQRLKEKPRSETIVFVRTIHSIASSRRNGENKQG